MFVMWKVGLGSSTTAEFLAKARNIVTQHRELQNQMEALHSQIGHLEMAQLQTVSLHDNNNKNPLPCNRWYLCSGDCMQDKMEDY